MQLVTDLVDHGQVLFRSVAGVLLEVPVFGALQSFDGGSTRKVQGRARGGEIEEFTGTKPRVYYRLTSIQQAIERAGT